MKNKTTIIILLSVFLSLSLFSQEAEPVDSVFSIKLTSGLGIPLRRDTNIFMLGGGADFSAQYQVPIVPRLDLSLQGEVGYNYSPIHANTSVSLLAIGGGLGVSWKLLPRLIMGGYFRGGYFYSFLNANSGTITGGGNPFLAGGAVIDFMLFPTIGLGVEASYRGFLGFRSNIVITLAVSYHFPKSVLTTKTEEKLPPRPELLESAETKGGGIEVQNIAFDPIFPVFFKYYDDHPIGRATLFNPGDIPVEDIKVSFLIKRYMDDAKQITLPESLKPGEKLDIELYGLLTETVLEVSEGTKVTSNITLEYNLGGEDRTDEFIETIRIYNRNAMTWDDDRRAAAFVTAKDSAILRFSKNVAGMIKSNRAVNVNFNRAMGIHEAIALFGMSYIIDPTTPYTELSKDKLAVDFLQFPRQTLEYKAGDCDDLSILYCALLESIGIETAFVTVPGHIYMAFSLDMAPDEARAKFLYPDDLIFREGGTWLPVEVTQIGDGFLEAWQTGAKEWRENLSKQQTGFFPIHEAWEIYEPVGFGGERTEILLPAEDTLKSRHDEELSKFIEREISPKVAKLQGDISRTGGSAIASNKLGVLYARYGLDEKAEAEFKKALLKEEYLPALINMGNLYYLNESGEEALKYYERASQKEPQNPKVLLCIARANHAIENYASARRAYSSLKELDADLASRFAYLDLRGEEANRAAEIAQIKGIVLWEE